MPDIRTTFQPGTVVTVGDAEYLDLKRQGLVREVVTNKPAQVKAEPKTKTPPAGDDQKTK